MDLGFDENTAQNKLVFKKIRVNQLDDNPENDIIYERDEEADSFLKEDIQKNGVLNPIIIIKSDAHAGRYTIVSGHRRTRVARELGITEIEAREIIAITDQEKAYAKIMLITANSTQRDRKPSEKAKEVLYLKEVTKDAKIENVARWIAKATKMSERNVYRYEKLANQPQELQEAVDKGEMSVKQVIGEVAINPKAETEVDVYKQVCKIKKLTDSILLARKEDLNNQTREGIQDVILSLEQMIS
jgi:ParB/RepB/Spo0J family partition protein